MVLNADVFIAKRRKGVGHILTCSHAPATTAFYRLVQSRNYSNVAVISKNRVNLQQRGNNYMILNWSVCTKPCTWVVMYLSWVFNVSILHFSAIFQLDLRTISTVWYFWFFACKIIAFVCFLNKFTSPKMCSEKKHYQYILEFIINTISVKLEICKNVLQNNQQNNVFSV